MSAINLKMLSLRNFLSYGANLTEIDLNSHGSTLIVGKNIDTPGASNGSGKTVIINALCYALYNKTLDNISLQRLINSTNSIKNTLMEVRLTLDKGVDEYEIYRCRGEAYNISVMKNGTDITLDSVSENDKLIEEIIGISYELFTKIIIFSGNSLPFLMMPVSQQRQQIEELFNITILSEKAVKLKELIKTTEGEVMVQEAVVKEQEIQLRQHDSQVLQAEQRIIKWDDDRETQLRTLEAASDKLRGLDIDAEKGRHLQVQTLSEQRRGLSTKLVVVNRDVKTLNNEVTKLTSELEHLADQKCPYCLQKYVDAEKVLAEKYELLEKKVEAVEALKIEQINIDTQIIELDRQIKELKSSLTFSSFEEVIKAQATAFTAAEKIGDLTSAINPHIEALETLREAKRPTVHRELIDGLKKDIEHQQFLLKLLTDKNSFIRRRIINRTVPFLNTRLMSYTKELGLPHVVKFDDDMSCTVSEYGRELDFGNLSSGEKKRVNMSLSLAFRDVLHHLHSRVNCLIIDEIDASLDGPGVEGVFKLLKQKSRDDDICLWIISHRPEAIGRFDNELIVRKENGFSTIIDRSNNDEED